MSITNVYNSFRWLVAPLVGLLFVCQVLAICIVSISASSFHFPSETPVHVHAHGHGHGETLQGLYVYGAQIAESEQQLATTSESSAPVIESTKHSLPHSAEHDCCDANEDTLRTAIFITLAFGIVLSLMRIKGAPNFRIPGALRRNSSASEEGYPRPHLVYCKLLN